MEAIDLINHKKRDEDIEQRREINRLTNAALEEKEKLLEKRKKLREKLEKVKLADQEASQKGKKNYFLPFF